MSAFQPRSVVISIAIISATLLGNGWVLTGALLLLIARKLRDLIMQEHVRAVIDGATDQDLASMAEVQNPRPFEPFPVDVFVARAMLAKARPPLPPELIDIIIELAEYWPCSRTVRDFRDSSDNQARRASRAVSSDARNDNWAGRRSSLGNEFLIRAPPIGLRKSPCSDFTTTESVPLSWIEEEAAPEYFRQYLKASMPTVEHPVRKIVFTITSRDQGWASQQSNTYESSWTWFEAGLERFDPKQRCPNESEDNHECSHYDAQRNGPFFPYCKLKPVHPSIETTPPDNRVKLYHSLHPDEKYTIQRNVVGDRTPKMHTVVWSRDDNDPLDSDELGKMGRGRDTGTGQFVRDLKVGDVVNIWAKARFPAWVNYVDKVMLEIYWAV